MKKIIFCLITFVLLTAMRQPTTAGMYLYGTLTSYSTGGCVWNGTATSFSNFAADANCPTPATTLEASAPTTKIPGIRFNKFLKGNYIFVFIGAFGAYESSGTDNGAYWRITDGIRYSPMRFFRKLSPSAQNETLYPGMTFHLANFVTRSNVTIQLQYQRYGGDNVQVDANRSDFQILVYRQP